MRVFTRRSCPLWYFFGLFKIFFVISFVVASLFMDVFAVGADTVLLCYCLEMDVLRGMSYACPDKLKGVM